MSDTDLGSLFPDAPQAPQATPYRVLARKYRPSTFAELIGQDALVRTLTNAFAQNRIAHAFMLTGVRGVGKTTTARIIARALNCIGPDGRGGPTITPCGVCNNCIAIAADRHVDVQEMDAASRTGVDDIRDLIEGVRYAPGAARYKVYIVDEVHMLSKNAFNALLKTLEEPPPHVKFIFATTEIRKVPITVLSRCQRFDLRRIDSELLIEHFNRIAAAESIAVDPEAMSLIARAADGSVRDGLSLLDQAIARGGSAVTAEQVRDMLGLADRSIILDLFESTMSGDAPGALETLSRLHAAGADPMTIVEDLLEVTHTITRLRLAPRSAGRHLADQELARCSDWAGRLGMPILTRTWQLLLKGAGELQTAPNPQDAVEMIILRLIYAADLPSPSDLIRQIQAGGTTSGGSQSSGPSSGSMSRAEPAFAPRAASGSAMPALAVETAAAPTPVAATVSDPKSFRELVQLFSTRREGVLEFHLTSSIRLVRFEPGIVEFNPLPSAPRDLAAKVGKLLSDWTGRRWIIGISSAPGEATLAEKDQATRTAAFDSARQSPIVQALLEAFPGAVITDVRDLAQRGNPVDDATETGETVDSGESGWADDAENGELL